MTTAEKPQPSATGAGPAEQGAGCAQPPISTGGRCASRPCSACLLHVACLTCCCRYRSDTNEDRSGGGQLRQMLEGAGSGPAVRTTTQYSVNSANSAGAVQVDRDRRLSTDKMRQPIRCRVIRRCFLLGTPAEKAGRNVIRAISNGLRLFPTSFRWPRSQVPVPHSVRQPEKKSWGFRHSRE